jgi:hypothetical protein
MHYARLGRRLANSFLVALSAREEKHDVDWHLARRHGSTILALRVGTGWRQQSDSVQVAASSGDQIQIRFGSGGSFIRRSDSATFSCQWFYFLLWAAASVPSQGAGKWELPWFPHILWCQKLKYYALIEKTIVIAIEFQHTEYSTGICVDIYSTGQSACIRTKS